MQLTFSTLAASAVLLSLPCVRARATNPKDRLDQRDIGAAELVNARGRLEARDPFHQEYKGPQARAICVQDVYSSILHNQTSSSQFCCSWNSIPQSTTTVYITPTTTTTIVTRTDLRVVTQPHRATRTITATVTSPSYVAKAKRQAPATTPAPSQAGIDLIIRDVIANGTSSGVSTESDVMASVNSGLSSACSCLDITACDVITETSTDIAQVVTVGAYELTTTAVDVTQYVSTTTTVTIYSVVPTASSVTASASISNAVSAITASPSGSSAAGLSNTTIADPFLCPGSNSTEVVQLVGAQLYKYVVLCDFNLVDNTEILGLHVTNATDCEARCSELDRGFGSPVCHGFTFTGASNTGNNCFLKQDISNPVPAPGFISAVLVSVGLGDSSTTFSNDTSGSTSNATAASLIVSSVSATSISVITPPAVFVNGSSSAWSTYWSSASTDASGYVHNYWSATYTSGWTSVYYTTYTTVYATSVAYIVLSTSAAAGGQYQGNNANGGAIGGSAATITINGGSVATSVYSTANSGDTAFATGGSGIGGGSGGGNGTGSGSGGGMGAGGNEGAAGSGGAVATGTTFVNGTAVVNVQSSVASGSYATGAGGSGIVGPGSNGTVIIESTTIISVASSAVSGSFATATGGSGIVGPGSNGTTIIVSNGTTITSVISGVETGTTATATGGSGVVPPANGSPVVVISTITSNGTIVSIVTSTVTGGTAMETGGSDIVGPLTSTIVTNGSTVVVVISAVSTGAVATGTGGQGVVPPTYLPTPPLNGSSRGAFSNTGAPRSPYPTSVTGNETAMSGNLSTSTSGEGVIPPGPSATPNITAIIESVVTSVSGSAGFPSPSSNQSRGFSNSGAPRSPYPGESGYPTPSVNTSAPFVPTGYPPVYQPPPGYGYSVNGSSPNGTFASETLAPTMNGSLPTVGPTGVPGNLTRSFSNTGAPRSPYPGESSSVSGSPTVSVNGSVPTADPTEMASSGSPSPSGNFTAPGSISAPWNATMTPPPYLIPTASANTCPCVSIPTMTVTTTAYAPCPACTLGNTTLSIATSSSSPSASATLTTEARRRGGETATQAQIDAACANQYNIVYNDGFELVDASSNALGWNASTSSPSIVFLSFADASQHTTGGACEGRVVSTDRGASIRVSSPVTLCPGQQYLLSAFTRNNRTLAECSANFFIGSQLVASIMPGTQWDQIIGSAYTAGSTAQDVSVDVAFDVSCAGSGQMIFDVDDVDVARVVQVGGSSSVTQMMGRKKRRWEAMREMVGT